ncbi:hypothetical protein Y032_0368g74 [Ancylostoma ceylanicum]|uniref:Uncharacterized protein n=1 Tax=Ancylostoma ceylanicum TaxID=53326 RepID=A0A016RVT4_9BILA|nr:hypothetical protein Y032_0368g74 [Ancylostoma ceylanicum]
MLSDIFGDFVIDEEDTVKERVQFCTPEQYRAEIHNSGWFLNLQSRKDRKDEEERELVNHRAAYFFNRGQYVEAEYKSLLHDFKHSRTHSVAVIDSLIRCALKVPSFPQTELLRYLREYEQSALDYGDQLQYHAEKEVYAHIDGEDAQRKFVDAVCLLCATVDLPEHWLAFGARNDLEAGDNFRIGYHMRALVLLERHLNQAHGFVVDVLRKKIALLEEKLASLGYSSDQVQEARLRMGVDLVPNDEKAELSEELQRPAHDCRSKIGVYKTADDCKRILSDFRNKFRAAKMEKEGEEEEVFEIDDFTVITEFERFVVAIDALVQEWGLIGTRPRKKYPKGALRVCAWQSKSSTVNFGESNKLKVTYYYPDLPSDVIEEVPCSENDGHISSFGFDMASSETDFIYHSNITTMYGVSEYIVMSPADQVDDAIMTEDQKNLVISAFRVAQHSVDCEIPMFIQFGHIDRQLFFGTSCNKSVVTHYGGSHLRKSQMRHTHLSGLLELFKEHVKCPISLLDADDIRVSVQFDYNIKFPSYPSKYIDDSCEILECHTLPFGSRDDPLSEFNVIATWPNMKEEMINENEYHSDLDLLSAFNWAGSVQFQFTEGLLDYALSRIIDLPQSKEASETAFSLLGLRSSPSKPVDIIRVVS